MNRTVMIIYNNNYFLIHNTSMINDQYDSMIVEIIEDIVK